MKYNKLVRDKIPDKIKQAGSNPILHTADENEYGVKLNEKLREEVDEFLKDGDVRELADILEVVYTISETRGVSKEKLERTRKEKLEKVGGFKNKIILDEVN